MARLRLSIVRFVDRHQPGWVECHLVDAERVLHRFIEKVPVVSKEYLWEDTNFPRAAEIEVTLISRPIGEDGALHVEIDTWSPHGIESTEGRTRFVVDADLVVDAPIV